MEQSSAVRKKVGKVSYLSLLIGVICFLIVFVPPTRIASVGNLAGDYLTLFLTLAGVSLSVAGIAMKEEKNGIPIIALLLSSSFLIFWIMIIVLVLTEQMNLAP